MLGTNKGKIMMNKKGFLPSHDWGEEVGNHTGITLAGELPENRDHPVSLSPVCSLHWSLGLSHNQALLFFKLMDTWVNIP